VKIKNKALKYLYKASRESYDKLSSEYGSMCEKIYDVILLENRRQGDGTYEYKDLDSLPNLLKKIYDDRNTELLKVMEVLSILTNKNQALEKENIRLWNLILKNNPALYEKEVGFPLSELAKLEDR